MEGDFRTVGILSALTLNEFQLTVFSTKMLLSLATKAVS